MLAKVVAFSTRGSNMSQNNQDPTQQRPGGAQTQGQSKGQNQGQNQGEGNREAAANFNRAEREFVDSPRGQQKIHEGTQVKPGEDAELSEAERRARERAKAQDSNRM
jgi:hypothetical protein